MRDGQTEKNRQAGSEWERDRARGPNVHSHSCCVSVLATGSVHARLFLCLYMQLRAMC